MANFVDDAAQALRGSRLYVDTDAATEFADAGRPFDDADQSAVRDALNGASTPIFVAALPAAAEQRGISRDIAEATSRDGSYVVIASPGGWTDAASNIVSGQLIGGAADGAAADSGNVSEFVDNLVCRAGNSLDRS